MGTVMQHLIPDNLIASGCVLSLELTCYWADGAYNFREAL